MRRPRAGRASYGAEVTRPRSLTLDLCAAAAAVLLVAAAVLVGRTVYTYDTLIVGWPPLLGRWDPHVGPGTPAAVLVATAAVAYGPALAGRLPWRALLAAAWGTAMAWTWSLALVDGWHRGVAGRLTTGQEYLTVIDRWHDVPATLRDFTGHILLRSPDNWPAHVAGHPPGATLTFVLLDRIGLGGGGWAGAWCITVGATGCVAVLVAVRALAGERPARRAAPFLVLAPAAVWTGTSADGYFAAVAAWAVALLALAVTGRSPWWAAGSGLLFGLTCYLSYGLTLFAVIGAAVLWLGRRGVRERPVLFVPLLAGAAVVPLAFTVAGFDWWEAYRLLVERYYEGAAGVRPYGYWVWANLACTVLITGLATVAGLRRAAGPLVRRRGAGAVAEEPRLAFLVAAGLLALLIADLSGMSKAETERIWLPFALWLLPAGAFLTRPRAWLAAQAVLALLLNHLVATGW
ncbi:putative integral membrane protein [Streptomyces ambofaciens ATCC 23877]|uniref:Putative integral membrane protein n=1 Tax=Streptomyces ambofaciens (strain ATCC 23877 / 3486 / DSM 40053 / JCM 4204 / NBRC 12836 / NRRL B-2516) TaxID=278992 RepID=A0A0K2AVD2_STRA7|nr:putative integral membrane protein [Streptomyces ambofaciens ATCC 23877]